jgi:hypothetical protein
LLLLVQAGIPVTELFRKKMPLDPLSIKLALYDCPLYFVVISPVEGSEVKTVAREADSYTYCMTSATTPCGTN